METQAAIVTLHSRNEALRHLVSYGASVIFVVVAAALVVFAPENRTTAANIVSVALLVLAAGIAGFTKLRARVPAVEVEVDRASTRDR